MTPDAINVAIAEALGWKFQQIGGRYIGGPVWEITDPDGNAKDRWAEMYRSSGSRTGVDDKVHLFFTLDAATLKRAGVPDFYGDLNAMAEAEKWLKDQPGSQFSSTCIWAYERELTYRYGPRATSPQRAKTFLQIIERWVE